MFFRRLKIISAFLFSLQFNMQCANGIVVNPADRLKLESRIRSGYPLTARHAPYQVLLIKDYSATEYFGGVLYKSEYVLTAAYNVMEGTKVIDPKRLRAYFGKTDRYTSDPGEIGTGVLDIKVHKEFLKDKNGYGPDIAILRIPKLILSEFIQPIKLINVDPSPYSGRMTARMTGWGSTDKRKFGEVGPYPPPASTQLQGAQVLFLNYTDCQKEAEALNLCNIYPPGSLISVTMRLLIPATALCGSGLEGIGACKGDTGGPVTCPIGPDAPVLCGIISSGHGCGVGAPTFFVNVWMLRSWIEDNTK